LWGAGSVHAVPADRPTDRARWRGPEAAVRHPGPERRAREAAVRHLGPERRAREAAERGLRSRPGVLEGTRTPAQAAPPAGGVQPSSAAPDGAGGWIVVWSVERAGEFDLYAQRVNGAGVPQWTPGGVPVCTANAGQFLTTVVPDGAGGVIVAWEDDRHLTT